MIKHLNMSIKMKFSTFINMTKLKIHKSLIQVKLRVKKVYKP